MHKEYTVCKHWLPYCMLWSVIFALHIPLCHKNCARVARPVWFTRLEKSRIEQNFTVQFVTIKKWFVRCSSYNISCIVSLLYNRVLNTIFSKLAATTITKFSISVGGVVSCPAPSNAKSEKGSGQTCIGPVSPVQRKLRANQIRE